MPNKHNWELRPSTVKGVIDVSGDLCKQCSFISYTTGDAIAEAKRRAKKYLESGNPMPPGGRFMLLHPCRSEMTVLHGVA